MDLFEQFWTLREEGATNFGQAAGVRKILDLVNFFSMFLRERSLFMDTPARAEGGGARKFSTRFGEGRKKIDEF